MSPRDIPHMRSTPTFLWFSPFQSPSISSTMCAGMHLRSVLLLAVSNTKTAAVPGAGGPACRGPETSRPGSSSNCKNRRPDGPSATAPPRLCPVMGRSPFVGHGLLEITKEIRRGDGLDYYPRFALFFASLRGREFGGDGGSESPPSWVAIRLFRQGRPRACAAVGPWASQRVFQIACAVLWAGEC